MTVADWVCITRDRLTEAGIESAALDAELLLSCAFRKERTWLKAHPEAALEPTVRRQADTLRLRREQREPLAYLTGHKEFYGRDFLVTTDVLIPRPESEEIIELARSCNVPPGSTVLDAGTGSGCLGITIALELSRIRVTLLDVSEPALEVARQNAQTLNASVAVVKANITQPDTLSRLPGTPFSVIVANLPYIDPVWPSSPELDHEPSLALFAGKDGMAYYQPFLAFARQLLSKDGRLILEADPRGQQPLRDYAASLGYRLLRQERFSVLLAA